MKNKTFISETESNILTTGNLTTGSKRYTDYIKSLNRDQKDLLLGHFNSIYECPVLGEHEMNIAYFAWLFGEGHLKLSSDFTMNNMDVEFNQDDYEISFEDEELQGGINLELTRSYYDLDRIYTILVLSQ